MAIRYDCPCGRAIETREEHAGKLERCPSCRMTNQVPDAPPAEPETGRPVATPRRPPRWSR